MSINSIGIMNKLLIVLAAAVAMFPSPVAAQAPPDPPPAQVPPAAPPSPEPPAKTSANRDGFVIQSTDGAFRVRLTGYAQGDARFYAGDGDELGTSGFLLRRVRPMVTGTVGKIFEFAIMPDFGGGVAAIQDSYLDAR